MVGQFAGITMQKNEWYFYSGASSHMCSDLDMFSGTIMPKVVQITVANNMSIPVNVIGDIEMVIKSGNIESCEVKMHKVLHVPQLCPNCQER